MHIARIQLDHPMIALAEIQAHYKVFGHDYAYVVFETDDDHYKKFGLTKSVFKQIMTTQKNQLHTTLAKVDWDRLITKSYAVRYNGGDEKKAAAIIHSKMENPQVDLDTPDQEIHLITVDEKVHITQKIWINNEDFEGRKAHNRPYLHPTSLDPKLARASINLLGIKEGILLDPFCGSGGILIEAALMGYDTYGCDFDEGQINRAKANLDYYHVDAVLFHDDALNISKSVGGIVTDVPYGKGSKGKDLRKLYVNFLNHAREITDRMVIIFPSTTDATQMIQGSGWLIKGRYDFYIHKSMTRSIFVLN